VIRGVAVNRLRARSREFAPGRRSSARIDPPAHASHGRLRAPRREDRHHPVEHRAGPFRREALSPARVRGVHQRRTKEATVVVPNDQLLAIGRDRLNRRRSLTGWKVDISPTRSRPAEAEAAFAATAGRRNDYSGRCAAILSGGAVGGARHARGVPAPGGGRPGPGRSLRRRVEGLTPAGGRSRAGLPGCEVESTSRDQRWWRPEVATSRLRSRPGGRDRCVTRRNTCVRSCGRKAPRSKLQRFVARSGPRRGGGARPGRLPAGVSCFERTADHRAFNRVPKPDRRRRSGALAPLH
jgi:hypothetical protein